MDKVKKMDKVKIYLGAASIRTCLGNKEETLSAMEHGKSGLGYCGRFGMNAGISDVPLIEGYTRFESLVISQLSEVMKEGGPDLSDSSVQLIISTTKGNVSLLDATIATIFRKEFSCTVQLRLWQGILQRQMLR